MESPLSPLPHLYSRKKGPLLVRSPRGKNIPRGGFPHPCSSKLKISPRLSPSLPRDPLLGFLPLGRRPFSHPLWAVPTIMSSRSFHISFLPTSLRKLLPASRRHRALEGCEVRLPGFQETRLGGGRRG